MIDGFAAVYESEFQRQGCLYLTGRSNTFRTILSVGVFLVTLVSGAGLFTACVAAVLGIYGDLFASVLTGALTRGAPLLQAARTAVDFVGSCVARSVAEGAGEAEGVDFEPLLRQLTVK